MLKRPLRGILKMESDETYKLLNITFYNLFGISACSEMNEIVNMFERHYKKNFKIVSKNWSMVSLYLQINTISYNIIMYNRF